jgi:hypothetical protein
VTDVRASEIALNRALWAVMNERFTDAAAEDMWARLDVVWGLVSLEGSPGDGWRSLTVALGGAPVATVSG